MHENIDNVYKMPNTIVTICNKNGMSVQSHPNGAIFIIKKITDTYNKIIFASHTNVARKKGRKRESWLNTGATQGHSRAEEPWNKIHFGARGLRT